MFLRKGVLKICSKFRGEHPCRSAISVKLQRNFTEIGLRHGCSPVRLLHILRTPFPRNTSGWLLLFIVKMVIIYISRWKILRSLHIILWNLSMAHIPLWLNVWQAEWSSDVLFACPFLDGIEHNWWTISLVNCQIKPILMLANVLCRLGRDGALNNWPCCDVKILNIATVRELLWKHSQIIKFWVKKHQSWGFYAVILKLLIIWNWHYQMENLQSSPWWPTWSFII